MTELSQRLNDPAPCSWERRPRRQATPKGQSEATESYVINHIFVYGTLRPGQRAEYMWRDNGVTHVDTYRLDGACIFPLGGFPGVRLCSGPGVVGDLLFMESPDAVLERFDQYEGCAHDNGPTGLYSRRVVEVAGVQAYIYEYNGPVGNVIESGDWVNDRRQSSRN